MIKYRFLAFFLVLMSAGITWYVYSTEVGGVFGTRPFKLGLDLNGGTHLVYKADVSKIAPADVSTSMAALQSVIEKRVNVFGVSEPIVQVERSSLATQGAENKLIVELPGVTDIDQAVRAIGRTPKLEFKLLKQSDEEALRTDPVFLNATTSEQVRLYDALFKETGLTGASLSRASFELDINSNQPTVVLRLSDEGRAIFAEITKNNIGDVLAIFLDGTPLSLPVIRQEIRDGIAVISGQFTPEEARVLVRDLNYGSLPVPIELISTQTIGASLGEGALQGGIVSGIVAMIVVSVFMLVWYRVPGIAAILALAMYGVITLALFKLIPVTLTSAGIAGFILSLGMAVDANILIFERMKEELIKGASLYDAMHQGFQRAWSSIRDSNTSSIITGVILYYLGSSSVITGFALVFVIGVFVSMFSAITASRIILYALAPSSTGKASRLVAILFSNGLSLGNKSHH